MGKLEGLGAGLERLISRILDKILSGRFIATVFVIGTYCSAIHEVNKLVGDRLISVETYIAVLGAFGALATYIVKAYFDAGQDKTAPTMPEKPIASPEAAGAQIKPIQEPVKEENK